MVRAKHDLAGLPKRAPIMPKCSFKLSCEHLCISFLLKEFPLPIVFLKFSIWMEVDLDLLIEDLFHAVVFWSCDQFYWYESQDISKYILNDVGKLIMKNEKCKEDYLVVFYFQIKLYPSPAGRPSSLIII